MGRCYGYLRIVCIALGTFLLFGWATWLLSSCNTVRRIQSVSTAIIKDSTQNDSSKAVSRVDSNVHIHIEKDTAVGLAGGISHIHLDADDLLGAFNSRGEKIKQEFHQDNGRFHATVTVNTDGSADIDCNTDSLTVVIKGLIMDNVYRAYRYDSLQTATSFKDVSDSTATLTTVTEGEHKGWLARIGVSMWNSMAVLGIVVLVVFLIKLLINRLS